MVKVLLFLWKHKILKDPINLSYHTKEFFNLSKNNQRKVLHKYFNKLSSKDNIAPYFIDAKSRYYDNNEEITFFNSEYFDKSLINQNIYNLAYIDKFKIDKEKIDDIIKESIQRIKENNNNFKVDKIVLYPDKLPNYLSINYDFMKYIIEKNYYNVKYLKLNEEYPNKCRELIKEAIDLAEKNPYNLNLFLKNDKTLPNILLNDINFINYLIKNDLNNIKYLDDKLLSNITVSNKELLIDTIINSLKNDKGKIEVIQENYQIASILNRNTKYIKYIINDNIYNMNYIDWHNIPDKDRELIINNIVSILREQDLILNIDKYPFKDLLLENFEFMKYLIEDNPELIAYTKVSSIANNEKLVQLFFKIIEQKKYKFQLKDFLLEDNYLNHYLVENKNMLYYFFKQNIPVIKYINFFNLNSSYTVVDNILKIIDHKSYEFHNDDFLVNNKYPIALSNHYRFMKFAIDKNFNNLSYIDTSMIDERELKRIINYACKMVYYIRGNNKKLSFDIDGYFKNSDIIDNEYFKECLKSL